MKYPIYILLLTLMIGCKAPSLDYGERYLVKNYEVKRRKKIEKYLTSRQKMIKKFKPMK